MSVVDSRSRLAYLTSARRRKEPAARGVHHHSLRRVWTERATANALWLHLFGPSAKSAAEVDALTEEFFGRLPRYAWVAHRVTSAGPYQAHRGRGDPSGFPPPLVTQNCVPQSKCHHSYG